MSLYNKRSFDQLDLADGDRVGVVRSGAVIPKITRVVERVPRSADRGSGVPQKCPAQKCSECSSELDVDYSQVILQCFNVDGCPPQMAGRIDHWCRHVGIDDLSKKRLASFIEHGYLATISDLYRLNEHRHELEQLAGLGPKMVAKILAHIEKSKDMDLVELLAGLGISGLQKTTARDIIKKFTTLSEVRAMSVADLVSLDGFAEKSAQAIVEGLEARSELIEELLSMGVVRVVSRVGS